MENLIPDTLRDRLAAGDPAALSEATALLYRELRATARSEMRSERKNHTLQPTGLVHEVLIRMRASAKLDVESANHFVNLARGVMRHVLKDHARAKETSKRRHLRSALPLEELEVQAPPELAAPDWNTAIGLLEKQDPQQAQVIELKYELGHSWDEIASRMKITPSQARYLEQSAVAWLRKQALRPQFRNA